MNKLNLPKYFKKYAFIYLIALLAMTASTFLDQMAPLVVQHIVDDVLLAHNIGPLKLLLLGILAIGVGRCIFQYTKEFLCDYAGSKIASEVRINLFQKIQSLSANFFDGINSGELMSRVKDDVDRIWDIAAYMGILLAEVVIRTVTTIYFLFRINWQLALIPCAGMVAAAFIALKMEKKLDVLFGDLAQKNSELNNTAAENLAGVRTVKAFAREGFEKVHDIKPADVRNYLGAPEYSRDKYQGNEYAGVVTGLAWTAVGGEILFVETSLSKGKGGKLTLTGNLGDVMKESAMLALEYLKAHTCLLDISEEIFDNWNIHVHVPEGAIPKDGPSAGITMVTSLASALTQRKVKPNLAMTGEITLRGKVLPVGGIKEKILAAKRAGIKEIILCEENRKNIEEIQPMYLKGLTFHYVSDIKEVLDLALTDEKVNDAIDFCGETRT